MNYLTRCTWSDAYETPTNQLPNINGITSMMNTTTWSILNCTTVTNPNVSIIEESDIVIDNTFNWFTGLGNILPVGRPDFYAAILHEIGHALGLWHSLDINAANNESNIMYYQTSYGAGGTGTAALDRRSLTSGGSLSLNSEITNVISPSRQTNLNNSGCTDINALTIRNISSPAITSSFFSFCSSVPITLSSSTPNGSILGYSISNQWQTIPLQTTQTITAYPPNTYTLNVTQSNLTGPPNSCTSTVTVNVLLPSIINTEPVNNIYACDGNNLNISLVAPFGSTYQWQRSPDGIKWVELINDFIFYGGVTTDVLNILHANRNFGILQYYRCIVTNGTNYCPLESDITVMEVDKTSIAPYSTVFAGDPPIHLFGGWPLGGSYSGDNVTCVDPPDCNNFIYTPPPIFPVLNPSVNVIQYSVQGCLPDPVYQQIQIIYCSSSPPCDYITTNIKEGRRVCLTYPYIDIPFSGVGIFNPGNVFTAYLTDASNSFSIPLLGGAIHSNVFCTLFSETIHCSIPTNTSPGNNYRIRIDSDDQAIIGELSPFDIEIVKSCMDQRSTLTMANVELFPNPANGKITILFLKNESSKINITFYDLQGRVCIVKRYNKDSNSESFDISMLKDGLYIVSIKNGEQTIQKKLIVNNY